MRRGVAIATVGFTTAWLLAACTGNDEPVGHGGLTNQTTPTISSSTTPSADVDPSTDGPAAGVRTQPLVVISNPRVPRLRLSLADARALAHGDPAAALDS